MVHTHRHGDSRAGLPVRRVHRPARRRRRHVQRTRTRLCTSTCGPKPSEIGNPAFCPQASARSLWTSSATRPARAPRLLAILADPKAAGALLGDEQSTAHLRRRVPPDHHSPKRPRGIPRAIHQPGRPRISAAALHCTTGKDRTGWAAAALLMLLGVSYDDVLTDYLLTNQQLLPSMQPLLDRFAAEGGDPELLLPVFGVTRRSTSKRR